VNEFKYLSAFITEDLNPEIKIRRRIGYAKGAFEKIKKFLTNRFQNFSTYHYLDRFPENCETYSDEHRELFHERYFPLRSVLKVIVSRVCYQNIAGSYVVTRILTVQKTR